MFPYTEFEVEFDGRNMYVHLLFFRIQLPDNNEYIMDLRDIFVTADKAMRSVLLNQPDDLGLKWMQSAVDGNWYVWDDEAPESNLPKIQIVRHHVWMNAI